MPGILIVDDQPCIRALLSEELVDEGYRVEGLGDAESVRTRLRFMRPDLVLLDLYLDGADGWELLRDIKRQDPELPVLELLDAALAAKRLRPWLGRDGATGRVEVRPRGYKPLRRLTVEYRSGGDEAEAEKLRERVAELDAL